MSDDNEKDIMDVSDFSSDEMILRKKKTVEMRTGVTAASIQKTALEALAAVREKRPLVGCIANCAEAWYVANSLFAAGASPVYLEDLGEATQFATKAGALFLNTGIATKAQTDTMRAAVSRANMAACPWALDPSGVGDMPLRNFATNELIRRFPAIIRGNASEILYLAGSGTGGRGTEPVHAADAAVDGAQRLSRVTRATVIATDAEAARIAAEDAPMVTVRWPGMPAVCGRGCVHGALCAAFLGALGTKCRWESAVAATLAMAAATLVAKKTSKGPGSFPAAFMDALAALKASDLKAVKVEVAS